MPRLALTLTAALLLSACNNTIAGAGRDMQTAGIAIQQRAQTTGIIPRPAPAPAPHATATPVAPAPQTVR